MKKTVRAYYNMFLVLEDSLKTNTQMINKIEGLEAETEVFFLNLSKLKELNSGLSNLPDKPATSKNKFEKNLDRLLIFNSSKLAAFAAIKGDTELLKTVAITPTAINRLEDSEKVGFARKLYDLVGNNLDNLSKHNLNANTQMAFKTATDDFALAIPTVRGTTTNNANTLAQYEALVEETYARIKNKMDFIVMGAETEEPDFVGVYLLRRKIVNAASSALALKGTVTTADGEPVKGATFTLDGKKIKSTAKGNIWLLRKDPGVYRTQTEKPGYVTTEQEVVIGNAGETARVSIVLKPL